MRRRWLITMVLFGTLGGIAGGAVGAVANTVAAPSVRRTIGWYSYNAAPPRYADYMPAQPRNTDWFALLGTCIGIGVAVGAALALVTLLAGRSVVLARTPVNTPR